MTIILILTCSQLTYTAEMDKNYGTRSLRLQTLHWVTGITLMHCHQSFSKYALIINPTPPVWEMWTHPHSICCAVNPREGVSGQNIKSSQGQRSRFNVTNIQSLLGLTKLSFLQKLYSPILIPRWPYNHCFRCWMVLPYASPNSAQMMNACSLIII